MFLSTLLLFMTWTPMEVPYLVRIETTGGSEKVGENFAITTTTGTMVSEDGLAVASSAAFAHHPDGVLVKTAQGERFPAEILGTDPIRKLTLLKIRLPEGKKSVPAVPAPVESFQVGMPVHTLGRGVSEDEIYATYGILSAVGRIRGLAVQTDAHTSVNNYGGVLMDAENRVVGVITPFGMTETSPLSGTELYDSGVGFAIPLAEILPLVPVLRKGDRKPYPSLGVLFDNPNSSLSSTLVLHVKENSPAARIGLRKGDKIISVNDRPTPRGSDVQTFLAPLSEGDAVRFVVLRDGQKISLPIQALP